MEKSQEDAKNGACEHSCLSPGSSLFRECIVAKPTFLSKKVLYRIERNKCNVFTSRTNSYFKSRLSTSLT